MKFRGIWKIVDTNKVKRKNRYVVFPYDGKVGDKLSWVYVLFYDSLNHESIGKTCTSSTVRSIEKISHDIYKVTTNNSFYAFERIN